MYTRTHAGMYWRLLSSKSLASIRSESAQEKTPQTLDFETYIYM